MKAATAEEAKCVGLDGMHPARIKNRTERHKPDGHARRLDEEQDHQLGVLGFAQGP